MAFITKEMLLKVASNHKIVVLADPSYNGIKNAVMADKGRAKEVFALAHEEWACQQLEPLLDKGVFFLANDGKRDYHFKVQALKKVIKDAALRQCRWTESPKGFTIGVRR
jgi:hypothetical protein